jgi:hypothetical protein
VASSGELAGGERGATHRATASEAVPRAGRWTTRVAGVRGVASPPRVRDGGYSELSDSRTIQEVSAAVSMARIALTPERFARGMTFEQYLAFIGTPENLRRAGSRGPRRDFSAYLRERYRRTQLTPAQAAALKDLAGRPDGPAKILMIAEEWSSDCRRDLPVVQRMAEAGGLELRIFTRDGETYGSGPVPNPDAPNADLVTAFLRRRGTETFQSIPVVAFFTRDFRLLYHYLEFPAVYHKERIRGHLSRPRAGETDEAAAARGFAEFFALHETPIFDVWADAAVAEMISLLHERVLVGSVE